MTTEAKDPAEDQTLLKVRRGRVDSVDLYEIKDSELDLLEKGSPAGLQLNFAIFLLSLAFSAICALTTATFASSKIETVFILVSVVGIIGGCYLLISWCLTRRSVNDLCKRIRDRIPPEAIPPDSEETPHDAGDDGGEPAG